MDAKTDGKSRKCPFNGGTRGHTNRDWWPDALDVSVLHRNSLCPIRWARRSTTPRNSRALISTR